MFKKFGKRLIGLALGTCVGATAAIAGEVEVLHYWTSGGEAQSIGVLKKMLEKKGHTWKDFAVSKRSNP